MQKRKLGYVAFVLIEHIRVKKQQLFKIKKHLAELKKDDGKEWSVWWEQGVKENLKDCQRALKLLYAQSHKDKP
jgi:hypothetical protein